MTRVVSVSDTIHDLSSYVTLLQFVSPIQEAPVTNVDICPSGSHDYAVTSGTRFVAQKMLYLFFYGTTDLLHALLILCIIQGSAV